MIWDMPHLNDATEQWDAASARSLAMCQTNTKMIRDKMAKQLKLLQKRFDKTGGEAKVDRRTLQLRMANVRNCLKRADAYLARMEIFHDVEKHSTFCDAHGIEPSHFIVRGGYRLSDLQKRLNDFLDEPCPFQEFDRGYE